MTADRALAIALGTRLDECLRRLAVARALAIALDTHRYRVRRKAITQPSSRHVTALDDLRTRRPHADFCFAMAEQSTDAAAPMQLVLVRGGGQLRFGADACLQAGSGSR
jgi:hypothetical protein